MAAFDDVSGLPSAMPATSPVSPDELLGVARTVASFGRRPAYAELEAELARALEAMGGPSALDEPDAAARGAKRKLGIVFVAALEKQCATL